VDSYSALPWVTWEAVRGVEVYLDEGYYDTRWLTVLWFTRAKVEGIVLKSAWHWNSECSVVNDPLGEPGRTPLYVGLRPCGAPWTVTLYFPRFSWEGSLIGRM